MINEFIVAATVAAATFIFIAFKIMHSLSNVGARFLLTGLTRHRVERTVARFRGRLDTLYYTVCFHFRDHLQRTWFYMTTPNMHYALLMPANDNNFSIPLFLNYLYIKIIKFYRQYQVKHNIVFSEKYIFFY